MKFILVCLILGCAYLLLDSAFERQYKAGVREGKATALKTNPPSEELEMTCAGLWIGNQNRRYFNRDKL